MGKKHRARRRESIPPNPFAADGLLEDLREAIKSEEFKRETNQPAPGMEPPRVPEMPWVPEGLEDTWGPGPPRY